MATIYDVARKAKVSASTAARVLRDKGYASEDARKAVLRAAKELGYMPDMNARNLRLKRSRAIGMLCSDVSHPVPGLMMRGVFDVCHPEGYHLTFGNAYHDPEEEIALLDTFRQNKVAGIIIMVPMLACSILNGALVETASSGLPMVILERAPDGVDADEVIVGDWVKCGRLAVEHLVSLGHRKIAVIAGNEGVLTGDERVAGYREALTRHGLQCPDEYLVRCDFKDPTEEGGICAMHQLLTLPDPPTAVFAATDMMALGGIEACRQRGLSVPKDMSFVGSGIDDCYMRLVKPKLTLMAMAYYEAGRAAGNRLLARIRGDRGPRQTIMLESKLVVRESTAPPKEDLG
jgi:LacI family transcriptional regulator